MDSTAVRISEAFHVKAVDEIAALVGYTFVPGRQAQHNMNDLIALLRRRLVPEVGLCPEEVQTLIAARYLQIDDYLDASRYNLASECREHVAALYMTLTGKLPPRNDFWNTVFRSLDIPTSIFIDAYNQEEPCIQPDWLEAHGFVATGTTVKRYHHPRFSTDW